MSIRIRPCEAGARPGDFLAARFTYHSAGEWLRLIAAGRVLLNGAPPRPGAPLAAGDTLAYLPETADEPPVDGRAAMLLDDPDFAVVNKSGNLPCHPAGRYFEHTLWALLRGRFGIPAPVFVNRLDRETSGAVLVAKNPAAARALGMQFERGLVGKRYDVWVEGTFPDRLEARGRLIRDPASPVRKKRRFIPETEAGPPGGERAETLFVRESAGGGLTRLSAYPKTGRTHQIRATLCSLGHPVAGDKLYGVDDGMFLRQIAGALTEEDRRRLRLPRQALHAASLRFAHPRTGAPVLVDAPLPEELSSLGPAPGGGAGAPSP